MLSGGSHHARWRCAAGSQVQLPIPRGQSAPGPPLRADPEHGESSPGRADRKVQGLVLIENRHGLIITPRLTAATGTGERGAAPRQGPGDSRWGLAGWQWTPDPTDFCGCSTGRTAWPPDANNLWIFAGSAPARHGCPPVTEKHVSVWVVVIDPRVCYNAP